MLCNPALLYPVSFSYENVSNETQKKIWRYVSSTQPPDEWCCVLVSLFLCFGLASWHSIFRYSVLNLLVLYWSAEVSWYFSCLSTNMYWCRIFMFVFVNGYSNPPFLVILYQEWWLQWEIIIFDCIVFIWLYCSQICILMLFGGGVI